MSRFLPNGSLDEGFGVGYRLFPGGGTGQGVARAPNGDLIVAGTVLAGAAYNITVLRIRPNGTLDPAFGTAGIKTIDYGGSETATDVLVQPDGKIVVSGYTDTDELVVRLNASGTPDTGFDVDGKVTLPFGAAAYGNAVALAADGKIVVGGYVYDADDPDLTAVRLLANGTPDPSFDGDGLKRIDPGTLDYGSDVLVQPDGKILVTGTSDAQFLAVRLTGGGALDQSFDGDGFVKAGPNAAASLGAVLQANGKILLSGQVVDGTQQSLVVRLQPGGTLDTTFSFDGQQRVSLPSSTAEAVALQTDGRILLGGTTTAAGNVDVWVARLEGDPPEIGGGPAPGQPSSPGGGGSGGRPGREGAALRRASAPRSSGPTAPTSSRAPAATTSSSRSAATTRSTAAAATTSSAPATATTPSRARPAATASTARTARTPRPAAPATTSSTAAQATTASAATPARTTSPAAAARTASAAEAAATTATADPARTEPPVSAAANGPAVARRPWRCGRQAAPASPCVG